MRVFLTGGTGFIGHYVAKELLDKGHELVIATRHPDKIPSLKEHDKVTMIESSLLDFESLAKGLEGADACIHIALGWGETPLSMLENDTRATVKLLELAALAGCQKFIYTSSTAAMGKMRSVMNETIANLPIDLYGATKSAGEAFVLGFKQGYGKHFPQVQMTRNVIRPGYTFGNPAFEDGCTQPDRRFLNIARAFKENKDIEIIKNDGTQFIHASQQAKLYLSILESDLNEEVFLGLSTEWVGWKQIAEKMREYYPNSTSKIIETDLGWSDKPMLYSVEKIARIFNLSFDNSSFINEHIRYWTEII
ncbi:MAG: NAD(P)-dependent oxidoreductase [Fibrobacter sp.]|nr:NAD(P)-dependent oxidoreductase [Fibrobacter sp.]